MYVCITHLLVLLLRSEEANGRQTDLRECRRASWSGPDWSSAQRRVQTWAVKSRPSV